MAKLILVRHGQTEWNVQGRFQGQMDVPLNTVGRRQATALGRRLAQEEIGLIYASDLSRARETATAIALSHDLAVRSEPRLREMDFGDWEGLTYDEIKQRDPEALQAWQANPLRVAPSGGENLGRLASRVREVLEEVARAHRDGAALLVAHGGSLQILLCVAFGWEPQRYWQFRLNPASVSELYVYRQGPILTLLNDTCHLAGKGERTVWAN